MFTQIPQCSAEASRVAGHTRSGTVRRVIDTFSPGGPCKSNLPFCNIVEIEHDDFSVATYGHLDFRGARVACGDVVERGAPIAISGNSGWTYAPHLHFHVVAEGQRVPTLFEVSTAKGMILVKGRHYTRV
ncbi:M23 family metallopeptidase [Stieleria varia]|uniref:M23 family metallopeptidase n=1 Tax=Stieleria varia TaxID=2528005 RepID=UPI0011B65840